MSDALGLPPRDPRRPSVDPWWRVFVLLRTVPGVYERTVRASGPIEAEQTAATEDPAVLETLGVQLEHGVTSSGPGPTTGYRRLRPSGWRQFRPTEPRSSDGHVGPLVPVVEILAPTP